MKPSPDNIFFYLHAKKQSHTNSPRLKCSTTTSQKPFKLQHRTQRYLATRWVAFSSLLCSELVSLLQGTSSKLSLGCVLFLNLSEWKWDLRFQSCPLDIPIFSISFTLGLGISLSFEVNQFKLSHLVYSLSLFWDQKISAFFPQAEEGRYISVPFMSNIDSDLDWEWEVGARQRKGWSREIMESDFFFLLESDTLMLPVQLFFLASSTFRNANSKPKVANSKPKIKMGPHISSTHIPHVFFSIVLEKTLKTYVWSIISKYDLSTQ